ncbi:radical SAM protein [Candidatus Aerophobetes bacterium]|nr:radical SAM protein [Candidatus Aerophobetes bacterium]
MNKAKHILNLLNFCRGGYVPITGPLKVFFEITFRCNFRCKNCDIWKKPKGDEINTIQTRDILKQLAKNNVLHVSFSGGEPFLRKDLLDLIKLANNLGMKTSVNTNGWFINHKVAKEICHSGLDTIYISLDGANANIHDYIRGIQGSFERVLKAIELIRVERNGKTPKIFTNITINKTNVQDLAKMVDLSGKRGVDGVTMSVVQDFEKYRPNKEMVLSSGYLNELKLQMGLLKKDYRHLLPHMDGYFDEFGTYIKNPVELYKYRCVAGYATVLIHPNGDVFPCPVAFKKMGNIIQGSFAQIWYSENSNLLRKKIKENKHPICWFDCMAPLNILFYYIRHFELFKLLNPRFLSYLKHKAIS